MSMFVVALLRNAPYSPLTLPITLNRRWTRSSLIHPSIGSWSSSPSQDPPFLLSTAPSHPFPLDLRGTGFALPQILQARAINHTTKLTEQRRWADNVNHNSLLLVSQRHSSFSFVSFSRYAQDFPHF